MKTNKKLKKEKLWMSVCQCYGCLLLNFMDECSSMLWMFVAQCYG